MTDLPSSWNQVVIKEVYEGLYDGPHATPPPADDGPVFLGIGNLTDDGHIDLSSVRHIAEEDFPRWTKRVTPRTGDIVFTYEATLNRYAIIPPGFRGCLGRRLALIRPDLSKVDTRFLHYYFFGQNWRHVIASNMLSGTTVDRVPLTEFPDFPINLPPLPTQRRIASILSAYDDLIENNTRRIAILEETARRLYEEWFVHFRFPGHEGVKMVESEIGPVPEGWEVKKLEDYGKIITGKTPSKKRPEFYGGEVPFLKLPDMHGKIFALETADKLSRIGAATQANKTIPANSLCVSCIGTAGIVNITSEPVQTNQQINSIVLDDVDDHEFLYFALTGMRETIERHGATGATMTNLSRGKFSVLKVCHSPPSLRNSFHNAAAPMLDLVLCLQRKNANLRAQRDLLLPKLISGEIDVSEIGEQMAEAAAE